jgi:hypothetical protein
MHQLSYVSDLPRGIFWVRELALLANLGRVSRKAPFSSILQVEIGMVNDAVALQAYLERLSFHTFLSSGS